MPDKITSEKSHQSAKPKNLVLISTASERCCSLLCSSIFENRRPSSIVDMGDCRPASCQGAHG